MKSFLFLILPLIICNTAFAQEYTGYIFNKKTGKPIEYVNIGIVSKNVGTVSDAGGRYTLKIDPQFDTELLRVSSIGFHPFQISVLDFRNLAEHNIYLEERVIELSEVIIHPKELKQRILGVTAQSKFIQSGFRENQLGYECGILIKLRKTAFLEKVYINFANCSYDSVFYRLNIYALRGKMNFENLLVKPIYISATREQLNNTLIVDIRKYNIVVTNDFLITIEHVRDLGPGNLYFCSRYPGKTYTRKTSQGEWVTVPVSVSISIEAKVED